MRILLPSITTPVPATSTGFCFAHGRIGFGIRIWAITRTTDSSGPPAFDEGAALPMRIRLAKTADANRVAMIGSPRILGLMLAASFAADFRIAAGPRAPRQKKVPGRSSFAAPSRPREGSRDSN